MNLMFVIRDSAKIQPGGDLNQLQKTIEAMKMVRPNWNFSTLSVSEFVSNKYNRDKYDVVVVHNICRPAEVIKVSDFTVSKLIISAIYVDFPKISMASNKLTYKFIHKFGLTSTLEYTKTLIKGILGRETFPPLKFIFQGYKKSIRSALRSADLLLVNSYNEIERLAFDLGFSGGFDQDFKIKYLKFSPGPSLETIPTADTILNTRRDIDVICVARIDEGKGQLHIIEKLSQTDLKVVIVGGPLNSSYAKKCIARAGNNITFTGHLSQSEIQSYLIRSKIHILNSAFEVFGLVTLDAALCGCHVMCTDQGDQCEHFNNIAVIMNRNDEKLLELVRELLTTNPIRDQSNLLNKFDWFKAAEIISRGIEELFID